MVGKLPRNVVGQVVQDIDDHTTSCRANLGCVVRIAGNLVLRSRKQPSIRVQPNEVDGEALRAMKRSVDGKCRQTMDAWREAAPVTDEPSSPACSLCCGSFQVH